jgi:AAA domain
MNPLANVPYSRAALANMRYFARWLDAEAVLPEAPALPVAAVRARQQHDDDDNEDALRLFARWQEDERGLRRDEVLRARTRYSVSFNLRLSYEQQLMGGSRVYYKEVHLAKEKVFQRDTLLGTVLDTMVEEYTQENVFRLYDIEVVWVKNITVVPVVQHDLNHQPMRGTALHFKFLGDIEAINKNIGQCVIDYILYELQAHGRVYLRSRLVEEFGGLEKVNEGISTHQMIAWARTKKYVSLWAVDPFLQQFNQCVAEPGTHRISMCYIMNNGHCYPVIDEEYKRQVSNMGRIEIDTHKLEVQYDSFHYVPEAELDSHFLGLAMGTIGGHEKVILVGTDNLSKIIGDVSRKTRQLVYTLKLNGHRVVAFEHPCTEKIYISSEFHEERVECCRKLYAATQCSTMRFMNQSFAKIAEAYLEYLNGSLKQSEYSSSLTTILDEYKLGPYITQFEQEYNLTELEAYDITRAYTSVLINNTMDWSIFSAFDNPTAYAGDDLQPGDQQPELQLPAGEYVIKRDFTMGNGTIKIFAGPKPANLVDYALSHGYITKQDISHYIKPSHVIRHDAFKAFAESVIDVFGGDGNAKMLINCIIGQWNSQYNKSSKGCITDNYETAMGVTFQEIERGRRPMVHRVDDLYFVRSEFREKKLAGHVPIYRQIIAASYIELDKLHSAVCTPESIVVAYNTDSIKVVRRGASAVQLSDSPKPGDIRREARAEVKGTFFQDLIDPSSVYEYQKPEWSRFREGDVAAGPGAAMSYDEIVQMVKGESVCVSGMAGSGKTHLIQLAWLSLEADREKNVALTHSNLSADNLRARGIANVFTFDTFFPAAMSFRDKAKKLAAYRNVFVDEFGNLPSNFMVLLWRIKQLHKDAIKFKLFGEVCQLPPVEDEGVFHDYDKSPLVMELCDLNHVTLKYRFTRFDRALYEQLVEFKQRDDGDDSSTLPMSMAHKRLIPSYTNIVYTNAKRKLVNDECLERFIDEFQPVQKVIDGVTYVVGMPVIAIANVRSTKPSPDCLWASKIIYNSQRMKVLGFNNETVSVCMSNDASMSAILVPNQHLKEILEIAFAVTCHKIQGSQIEGDYAIHELSRMSFNGAYVAISRGSSLDRIHFDYTPKQFKWIEESVRSSPIDFKPKTRINGLVYLLQDPCISDARKKWHYVGSTTQEDETVRLLQHHQKPTNPAMAKVMVSPTVTITVLERIKCLALKELLALENQYISSYNESITGVKLLNSKLPALKKTMKVSVVKAPMAVESLKKFAIKDDTVNRILTIRGMINGKEVPRFYMRYSERGREVVMLEAEEHRRSLLARYF